MDRSKRLSRVASRIHDDARVAFECGFRWALEVPTDSPAVPPEQDVVVLDLGPRERLAAERLLPATWWGQFYRGFTEGAAARTKGDTP